MLVAMSDVTQILSQIEQGDPQAAEKLLPLVYNELRRLAAAKMAREHPGQTLSATALVHEAYLRLVKPTGGTPQPEEMSPVGDQPQFSSVSLSTQPRWDHRGHFFAAAAEAMRRILVEVARRKSRLKHGADFGRADLVPELIALPVPAAELLAVHEALQKLDSENPQAASLVKFRYFAGFTIEQAAEQLGVSPRKASQIWTYARAWLAAEMRGSETD